MPTVFANGRDIFFEDLGRGEPLLLIAGFACDLSIWSLVVPSLETHFRTMAFDNRGVGQTSYGDEPFGLRDMAQDALGLLDALGIDRAHVAGHSMGGLIAQELTFLAPNRVRSLTLISSCSRVDERGRAIIDSWGDLPRQVDAVTGARLSLPWVYTSDFYARPGAIEQIIELIAANPHPPSTTGLFHQSRAVSGCNTSGRLHEIRCPTLVLVGREDALMPAASSEALAKGIRGAELRVIENTGHGLLIETPDAVAAELKRFLTAH